MFTDQISLDDWLYLFLRYCAMCIIMISFPIDDVISFDTNLTFFIKSFFHMSKKSAKIHTS